MRKGKGQRYDWAQRHEKISPEAKGGKGSSQNGKRPGQGKRKTTPLKSPSVLLSDGEKTRGPKEDHLKTKSREGKHIQTKQGQQIIVYAPSL